MKQTERIRRVLERGLKREWEHDPVTASCIHAMYLMECLDIKQNFSQVTVRHEGDLIARCQWDKDGVSFSDFACNHPKMPFFLRATLETIHQLRDELPLTIQ